RIALLDDDFVERGAVALLLWCCILLLDREWSARRPHATRSRQGALIRCVHTRLGVPHAVDLLLLLEQGASPLKFSSLLPDPLEAAINSATLHVHDMLIRHTHVIDAK